MKYTAYIAIAGASVGQVISRETNQGRIDLITSFSDQIQQGQRVLFLPETGLFADVRRLTVSRNETAALFVIECQSGCLVHVLAQSGYITGLTNSADLEMLAVLRVGLTAYGREWEPTFGGLNIDPPAFYTVLEPTAMVGTVELRELLDILFPLAEALAIGFFYTIRLDGPQAYEWEDPDNEEGQL